MNDEVTKWVRRHRLLRVNKTPDIYEHKKERLLHIFQAAAANTSAPIQPYVYESHHADIRQLPDHDTIICDVHFWDISMLVASSFYIDPVYDIKKLADALIVDSLLCHGNPQLALQYAQQFIRNPYVAAYNAHQCWELITGTVQMQVAFALLHEINHFYDESSEPTAAILGNHLKQYIDLQNYYATIINALDLSPLHQYLDRIEIKSALTWPQPENAVDIAKKASMELLHIVSTYKDLVHFPEEYTDLDENQKKELLFYACDNYIRGRRANHLPEEETLEEGVCDLLALIDLFDFRISGFSEKMCRKLAITGYLLCLLTIDMINGAMNIHKYSHGEGYQYMDVIYMRREKERLLLPLVVSLYCLKYNEEISEEEVQELFRHSDQVSQICDTMYWEFSDYIFSQDYTLEEFIPHGSSEWVSLYQEINRLMQFPI